MSSHSRAVQYVRMSTERQDYSIAYQSTANAAYACEHGYQIARTYSDEGVSGIGIERRLGLKALLADVLTGRPDFSVILVYDVSRWGRFQNPDQAAHYEFICNEAGVRVEYCAEPFENDGSVTTVLLKSLKRAMAAEYSRELSTKLRRTRRAIGEQGYWPGGPAGYGFRRQVVSRSGEVLAERQYGEVKGVLRSRTRLVLGPPDELATVRRIYRLYLREGMSLPAIATLLNGEHVAAESGRPWSATMVRKVLSSEKYMGTVIAGRFRTVLGGADIKAPRAEWQVYAGRLPAIVPRATWRAAQAELSRRPQKITKDAMLADLVRLEREYGEVSRTTVARHGRISVGTYVRAFGSVGAACQIAGCRLTARRETFLEKRASSIDRARFAEAYNAQLISDLKAVLAQRGKLTVKVINAAPNLPMARTLRRRFGSLKKVFDLVGYIPPEVQAMRLGQLAKDVSLERWRAAPVSLG